MLILKKIGRAGLPVWASVAVASAVLSGPAAAQEFCVVCSGPSAMYRCTIDNYRPGAAPNLGAVCTDAMTRVGTHSGCAVGRGITVLDCKGPLMRVDIAKPASPVVTNSAEQDAKEAKAKSEAGEPKTVLEMIKRAQSPAASAPPAPQPAPASPANRQTDVKPSQPATPPAAAKPNPLAETWRCMSSFFTKCGD